jgi:hypothetical protein
MITRYDQIVIDGRHWENRAEEATRGSLEREYAMGSLPFPSLFDYF